MLKIKVELSKKWVGRHGDRCQDVLDIELRETDKGPEFSVSGSTFEGEFGQCCGIIAAKYPGNKFVQRVVELWRIYHLNRMHAECEHQRALGWQKLAGKKITVVRWSLFDYVYSRQQKLGTCDDIEAAAIVAREIAEANAWKKRVGDRMDLRGPHTWTEEGAAFLKDKVTAGKPEEKLAGWVYEWEHPEGILSKPCPECGYKYGSEWKYMPIPLEVLVEMKELISKGDSREENC